jgi:predicted phage-related endonuclease
MSEVDRHSYLGSHAPSALLGISPWAGKADVYMQALHMEKPLSEKRFDIWYGNEHEALSAKCYERETGKKVVGQQLFFKSVKYPWMGCHIDGMVLLPEIASHPNVENMLQDCDPPKAAERGVEFKTAHPMHWREWGEEDDQVPEHYYTQCQHNMIITGLRVWDLCVSIGTFFRRYEIQYNEEIAQAIIDVEAAAWKEIEELRKADAKTVADRLFELTKGDEEARKQIVTRLWPFATKPAVQVPSEHYGMFQRCIDVHRNYKAEEGNWEEIQNEVKRAMGDCTKWTGPGGSIEWRKHGKGRAFVVKEIEAE